MNARVLAGTCLRVGMHAQIDRSATCQLGSTCSSLQSRIASSMVNEGSPAIPTPARALARCRSLFML